MIIARPKVDMRKIIKLVVMLLILHACGGTGSGASSPVTPAQIPTSVEYASGDVIMVGAFGGISGNLAAKGTVASGIPDAVYAITASGTFETATVDDECFYVPVPAGYTYALVFSYSDGVRYFSSSTLGLSSIPLNLVEGASAAGTASFADCAISASADISKATDGSVTAVELGTVTPSTSTVSASVTDASFLSQTGLTSSTSGLASRYDGPLTRFANSTYLAQMDAELTPIFAINGANTWDDAINAYVDPDLFSFDGYPYEWKPRSGVLADSAKLTLPFDVTDSNGLVTRAGTEVVSCMKTNVRYVFFCGDVDSGYVLSPAEPAIGTFTLQQTGYSSLPVTIPVAQSHGGIDSLSNVAMPFVSLTRAGDYITGLTWKWMIKESGTWRDMTYNEVRAVIMPQTKGGVAGYFYVNYGVDLMETVGLGINDDSSSSSSGGTKVFATPLAYSSYEGVTIDYKDIAGYQYYIVYATH